MSQPFNHWITQSEIESLWVMLICALRAQVKKLKIEIKNKFCIESITFATFKALNAQVPRKTFYI